MQKKRGPKPIPVAERFWRKVEITGECWNWTARLTTSGYGHFYIDGGKKHAHRVSYEMERGPIPDGMQIDHLCRNRKCVRPSHLEVVTLQENIRRGEGLAVQNARKTHCPKGHPYSGSNLYTHPKGRYRKCRACKRNSRRSKKARTLPKAKPFLMPRSSDFGRNGHCNDDRTAVTLRDNAIPLGICYPGGAVATAMFSCGVKNERRSDKIVFSHLSLLFRFIWLGSLDCS